MTEEPDIHGNAPVLEDVICDAILCEQYWYKGQLTEPANVVHLFVAGQWHRLAIDMGIMFWRVSSAAPEPYQMGDIEAEVRLDDLGDRLDFAGLKLESYIPSVIPGGSQVRFNFKGGRSVTFKNVDDRTVIVT
jgi:hypothetical protein